MGDTTTHKAHAVYVFDRHQQRLIKEELYPSLTRLLWQKPWGFAVSEIFAKHPSFSRLAGVWHNCAWSRVHIAHFVKQNNICLDELEKNLHQFRSFNDFFTRKLKPQARPINYKPRALISPADCRVLVYCIDSNTVVPIKGKTFCIDQLLGNTQAVQQFTGGICIVCRLNVSDYHRFCYVDDCSHKAVTTIAGYYRAVNPWSLANHKDVFCKNQRQLTLLQTKQFGLIAHIDVGALAVGKIRQHFAQGTQARKGQEKGLFEFGASTIVLLLQPNKVRIDEDIVQHTQRGIETRVRYGEQIGTAATCDIVNHA
ncbi:MAG: archaetidylserine decarboxylase [Myxococcota bacterium]